MGLKPTYGLVPVTAWWLTPLAGPIGPLNRDVTDCALLNSIAGHDPLDSTSAEYSPPDYLKSLTGNIRGLRIGLPKEYFVTGLDPDIERVVREAVARLEELGAEICEVSLPHNEYAVAAYYIVAPAEASSNLARYDGVSYGRRAAGAEDIIGMFSRSRDQGFGTEVKRRIHAGHLRPQFRLLRRILLKGAAGAHADQARLRPRF